jgi:hypothetical protein
MKATATALLLFALGCLDYKKLGPGKTDGSGGGADLAMTASMDMIAEGNPDLAQPLPPPDMAAPSQGDMAQPPADMTPLPPPPGADLSFHVCNYDFGTTCPWDEKCYENNLNQTLCGTQTGCGGNMEPCCWFGPSSGWGCDPGPTTCQSDTSSPNGTRCK